MPKISFLLWFFLFVFPNLHIIFLIILSFLISFLLDNQPLERTDGAVRSLLIFYLSKYLVSSCLSLTGDVIKLFPQLVLCHFLLHFQIRPTLPVYVWQIFQVLAVHLRFQSCLGKILASGYVSSSF